MADTFLTPEEVGELTGKERKRAQCDALLQMRVPFQIRPDGSPAVLRAAMEAALGYATPNERPKSPRLRIKEARGF